VAHAVDRLGGRDRLQHGVVVEDEKLGHGGRPVTLPTR
jgi:hypothetical protein